MRDQFSEKLKRAGINLWDDLGGGVTVDEISRMISPKVQARMINAKFTHHIYINILKEAAIVGSARANDRVVELLDDHNYITKLMASEPE